MAARRICSGAPGEGLLGLYGDGVHWNTLIGDVDVGHVGGEGEAYLGQWTLRAVAGAEFGNNATSASSTVTGIPGGFITTTTANGALRHVTRFFDTLTLEYYVTGNWDAWIGQRYLGGKSAAAVGTEYALPSNGNFLPTLFAEARLGEGSNNYGAWGGVPLSRQPQQDADPTQSRGRSIVEPVRHCRHARSRFHVQYWHVHQRRDIRQRRMHVLAHGIRGRNRPA